MAVSKVKPLASLKLHAIIATIRNPCTGAGVWPDDVNSMISGSIM
jgi:hypothetical protein